MAEETLFRVVSLAIIMLVVGVGSYVVKIKFSAGEEKIKQAAKKVAIHASVVVAVLYMVAILAIAGIS